MDKISAEDLFSQISAAEAAGNMDELDRLMGLELEDSVPETEPEPEVTEQVAEEDVKVSESPSDTEPTAALEAAAPEVDLAELERLRKVEHQWKSDAGRVAAYQKQIDQLKAELKAREQPATKTEAPEEDLDDDMKQLKEVDPLLYEALMKRERKILSKIEQSTKSTTEYQLKQQEQEVLRAEAQKLEAYYDKCWDVFDTPEWKSWLEKQSPGVGQLASSQYADDVILAMEKFARDMAPPKSPAVASATPVAQTPSPETQKVLEQRERKLSAPVARGTTPATTTEVDAEAIYRKAYEAELKQTMPSRNYK